VNFLNSKPINEIVFSIDFWRTGRKQLFERTTNRLRNYRVVNFLNSKSISEMVFSIDFLNFGVNLNPEKRKKRLRVLQIRFLSNLEL